MTGSLHPDIDDLVTAWNTGRKPDALRELQGDPHLQAKVRAEIARLEDKTGPRFLLDPIRPDAVSRLLHGVLTEMIGSLP